MRILWLKSELLHPIDKGGKIRTYQMLRELKKTNHVTYLCLDNGSAEAGARDKAAEYCQEVITVPHATSAKFTAKFYMELFGNLASDLPYALAKYVSPDFRQKIESLAGSGDYDLLICDFLAPAVNVPARLPIPKLLFQHNVEATIWRRHYEVTANPIKKAYFKSQWDRMRKYEAESCNSFHSVVAVSEEDAETMRKDYGVKNVSPIPTGVDTEYFAPANAASPAGDEIVFTGSMDWLPNDDAIRWFLREILPNVKKKVPEARVTIVGRNPSASILSLSRAQESVTITGRVPDVRPYMRSATVYIVPIRIGGGTRLKIYEAMAMGMPVVSTTIGAEGLDIEDGMDILLRDDPEAFADAVAMLLQDRTRALEIGSCAAARVQKDNSWHKVADDFSRLCALAVGKVEARSGAGG